MSKVTKRIIISVVASIMILGSIAMILLVPRTARGQADEVWYGADSFSMENITALEKAPDDDFTIMAITDVQFDDPFQSKGEIKANLAKMVEATKPDLIVTVGDNFAGIFNHFHVKAFVSMMDELGIPWAPIFGNHERDFNADLLYLAQEMQKSKLCLFKTGPSNIDGVGNYILNINENGMPICSLVMMDCNEEVIVKNAKGKRIDAYYESPRHSQVEWYKDNIKGITGSVGKTIPSILFTHTPLPEFATASKLYIEKSPEVRYIFGEGIVGGGKVNYGLFEAARSLGSTKHMYFGHEHENTLALEYKGIQLSFAVKTGNFSSFTEGKTGASLITVKTGGVIETRQMYVDEM